MNVFVVRVWTPGAGQQPEQDVRGVVEHLATGEAEQFRSAEDLLRILRAHSGHDQLTGRMQ